MSYDANKHVTDFHNVRVFVNDNSLQTARDRRDANRKRLKNGLTTNQEPQPDEFVQQGSYAMHTMVQSEVDTSDIDDGAVFSRADLKGPRDGDKSANEAKEMVRKALSVKDEFNTPPEVRKNCVRVYYNDGFHVDIPVYRTFEEDGRTKKEIASAGEWKTSDPEDITNWFNDAVTSNSPDETNGRQLRRIVRLLKYWSKSRSAWAMPSGFIISVLTEEIYPHQGWADRDDQALLAVMRGIRDRLLFGERVYRPSCGAFYQPYSSLSSLSSTSLIGELALDALLGRVRKSVHRVWVGNVNEFSRNGLLLRPSWLSRINEFGDSRRYQFVI